MAETWSEEREEQLTKLWAEGFTASQIAARIGGFDDTEDGGRCAVLSKARRMRLPGRTTHSDKQRPRLRRPAQAKPQRPHNHRFDMAAEAADLSVFAVDTRLAPADRITVVIRDGDGRVHADERLTADRCRWPLGDPLQPDFHFCGATKVPGLPYCDCHARIAFPALQVQPAPVSQEAPTIADHEAGELVTV